MVYVTELAHLFRKPVYPVLIDVDGQLITAKSAMPLLRQLARRDLDPDARYAAIDSSGEGWELRVLDEEQAMLSPSFLKRRWTKLQVIRLYNSRRSQKPTDQPYSEKSLSSKKLSRVISDIIQLTAQAAERADG